MSPDPGALTDWLTPGAFWLGVGIAAAVFVGWFVGEWLKTGEKIDLFITDPSRYCMDNGHYPPCGRCEQCRETHDHAWVYYAEFRHCATCATTQTHAQGPGREHR